MTAHASMLRGAIRVAILETAVVKDAATSRGSCHAFARNTPAVRIAFQARAFSAVVRKELLDLFHDDLLEGKSANLNKRKRKLV